MNAIVVAFLPGFCTYGYFYLSFTTPFAEFFIVVVCMYLYNSRSHTCFPSACRYFEYSARIHLAVIMTQFFIAVQLLFLFYKSMCEMYIHLSNSVHFFIGRMPSVSWLFWYLTHFLIAYFCLQKHLQSASSKGTGKTRFPTLNKTNILSFEHAKMTCD